MKKIVENLFLGDMYSAPASAEFILSCAAEIFEQKAPRNLWSEQIYELDEKHTYLNFKDYPGNNEIDMQTVKFGLDQIKNHLALNQEVYVHCVYGVNRSASMVFMYLVQNNLLESKNYDDAQKEFWAIYPNHSPNPGWRNFLKENYPYNF
jgi:protein-tyrosine phosphatase